MHKGIKVKLYPTEKQKQVLDLHFDGYRFAYNLCLEYKSGLWSYFKKNVSGFDMQKEIGQLRNEVAWLSKCKAECITYAALQVDLSYNNFFKGKGYPKYKSKKGTQSFTANYSISAKSKKLKFFKSKIKFNTSEHYHNILESHKIRRCTFKKDLFGDYWATCLIETEETKVLPITENSIGIDLGIKDLVITSEGEVFENKKFLKNQYYKLRRLQRRFSKAKKGGKNKAKLRAQIAKVSDKITNQKEHYYHQITNQLLNDNQVLIIENLNIQGMIKNHNLAGSISDASWSLFIRLLKYKAAWYGRNVIEINTFYPSSKTCSGCGKVKETLLLSERIYNCECGLSIDRDLNAAINIKKEGLKIPGLSVENVALAGSKKQKVNVRK